MPPWESRAETAKRGIKLYFCSRHDDGSDHTALHNFYRPRLPPSTVTAQGPLTRTPEFWTWLKSITVDAGSDAALRDLPVIALQTALFIDGPWPNKSSTQVPTRELRSYGLLVVSAPHRGFLAASVRRVQNGPFGDDNDDAVAESSDYAVAEMVLKGRQMPTIEKAVRALAVDIESKLRLRHVGAYREHARWAVNPLEHRGDASLVGINVEVEAYIEALDVIDDLYALWKYHNSPLTRKKGIYIGLAEKQGAWQGRGMVGPWALLSFDLKGIQEQDVELFLRDSRHCGGCGWCVHGLV